MKGNYSLKDKLPQQSKRRTRRSEQNPSRGLFAEENNTSEENRIKSFINRILNKDKDEIQIEGRRSEQKRTVSEGRDELSRSDYKPIHKYTSSVKDETLKHRRRNVRNFKTTILLVAGAALVATIIWSAVSLFSKGDAKDTETIEIIETENHVTVYIDEEAIKISTDAQTVGELFDENQIVILPGQQSTHIIEDNIVNGMEIFISNPMVVSVINNEIVNSVTLYGGRVADVFIEMEIELDNYDIVVPHLDTIVYDGMQINFTDIEIKEIQVVEDLHFETEEGETSTVESGYYHVENEGSNGVVQITYEVKLIDGVEDNRVEVKREVIEEATNRVILWGTATPSGSSSDTSSGDDNDDGSSYDDITVTNPGDQATNPSVPSAPSDYIEIMSGHVTAYTHTGNTTATGTWPRSTRTLDNPGSCAVVPGTIPYGSLLYVTGYGYCIAEDTGAFRHNPDRWNQIDLFMNTYDECITWGRRYDVKVYILRKGY